MKDEAPEKIYVSNYSSGLTYNWHNERLAVNDIEYIRTDAFIEKAQVWLMNNADMYEAFDRSSRTYYIDKTKLINDFKNYMKQWS